MGRKVYALGADMSLLSLPRLPRCEKESCTKMNSSERTFRKRPNLNPKTRMTLDAARVTQLSRKQLKFLWLLCNHTRDTIQ